MLTRAEIDQFLDEGFVVLRGAVPRALADTCAEAVWRALETKGVRRDDRATWRDPVVRVDCPAGEAFATAGTAAPLVEAYDQLIGADRWVRRRGVGGTVPVRFPSDVDPGDAGWHIDAGYEEEGRYRVNLGSRGRGLLALFLFTDTDASSAPPLLRAGSHHDVPRMLVESPRGVDWLPAAQAAAAASAHRPVVRGEGAAGDVFLCHPFLVHAASWPHRGTSPRMLAQPAIALRTEYDVCAMESDPAPVLRTIVDAARRRREEGGA